MIKLENILYATDFSELSLHALKYARSFAEAHGAKLHCVHVVDETYQYWMSADPDGVPAGVPTAKLIEQAKRKLADFVAEHLSGQAVRTQVRLGRPFVEIITYARENGIDLIVLTTHGRSGLKHALMGSTAERVVRKAPCAVLTVRHPQHDFVMP